ncbi:Symplekin [Hypsibius exemplaris]|uniref:Symplekin n=1 Tax=Hypsibius exemplaris TaxID=2072580 RepID=A0A1W0WTG9_HYPEX|nr:Symplekin [Hypsibius exemplaris]
MATLSSQEALDVVGLVGELMREANSMPPGKEEARVVSLRKAKDLILSKIPDLIDNFWVEMLATRHERSVIMIAFCLEWIQEACAKEPVALMPDAIPIVLQLMEHQSVAVQKASLNAAREIYRNAFAWILRSAKESEAQSVWTELKRIKDHVTYAIGEDYEQSHVGYRLLSYKFVETVITCQTPRDSDVPATSEDWVSSLDFPPRFQFQTRETVEEEAHRLLQTLEDYLTSPDFDVKYVDRESIIGCLFHLAKRRPQYLGRILTTVEFVHGNIPESYSKLEVEGLRKYLKAALMSFLRRSHDGDVLGRVVQLLINLGASNTDVNRARPKWQEVQKRKRSDSSSDPAAKRVKGYEDSRRSASDTAVASDPQALAVDINMKTIVDKLTPNNVIELVLTNMKKLPSTMPTQFNATYTPIGSGPIEGILQHLARLMAVQMVAAGVGPGVVEMNRRRQEEMSIRNQMDTAEAEDNTSPQQISSVLSRQSSVVTVVKSEVPDDDDGHSNDSADAKKLMEEMHETPDAYKATDKAFRLLDITEPIPRDDRGNAILSIVNEIISNDGNVLSASGEYLYHKCLIRFAVKIGLDSLRERIMKYILEDIGKRTELAFRWIYEEYAVARQMTRDSTDHNLDELVRYDECLTKFIRGFIDHPEYREGTVNNLYMEVPVVTEGAVDLLTYYCAARSVHGAMRLIQKLVSSRPNADRFIVPALEMTLNQRKDIQTQAVQTCVKVYETVPELREPIRDFAVVSMKLLNNVVQPPAWFFAEKYGRGGKAATYAWTEEYQKLCTTLFSGLLSEDPSLLPTLGEIYNEHPSDVKKTIFKVIEQPIKSVGMNAPEVLHFVKSPPKGSESLVLRIIHLLTETHPATPELIASIRTLYSDRIPDVRFLIPILNGLPKEDIFAALPKLIKLNPVLVQEVFHRLLGTGKHKQDSTQRKPSVTPAEVLIELHKIDLGKVDAKTLIKATGLCLEEKELYNYETMVFVLKNLVEIDPLPFLLMRTVLQTMQMHNRLLPFIMNILQRLVEKQVWNLPLLWEGFVKCCEKTVPSSFPVILLLPAERLLTVLDSHPALKTALQKHVQELGLRQRAFMSQKVLNVVLTGKIDLPQGSTVAEENPVDVVGVIAPLVSQNGSRVPLVIKLEEEHEAPAPIRSVMEEDSNEPSSRLTESTDDSNSMVIKQEDSDSEEEDVKPEISV